MSTTENNISKNTNQTHSLLESENIKLNRELIDDCFYINQKKWGTWISTDKEEKYLITSLTKQDCIESTRFYLKGLQEGFSQTKTHEGSVSGKI